MRVLPNFQKQRTKMKPVEQENYHAHVMKTENTSAFMKRGVVERRPCGPHDVKIKILYSGVCHSDLHQIRGEWPCNAYFPMVPGHEGAGIVEDVGSEVKKFKVGDHVGVGVMVGSCLKCEECKSGLENYCKRGFDDTYNTCLKIGERDDDIRIKNCEHGELLFGTYTSGMTVDEHWVFYLQPHMPLERCGPLLCAGITVYDPLVQFGCKENGANWKVGVLGFGGLGHMALKFAKAFGNDVYAISGSEHKREWANELGVKFMNYKDKKALKENSDFDFIIDTICVFHDVAKFMNLLKTDRKLCLVGIPAEKLQIHAFSFLGGRKTVVGSCIGGTPRTQEMLDYCAENNIYPESELIHPKDVNSCLQKLSTVTAPRARYIIDCQKFDDEEWKEDKYAQDPSSWKVLATVIPESANFHAEQKNVDFRRVTLAGLAFVVGLGILKHVKYN